MTWQRARYLGTNIVPQGTLLWVKTGPPVANPDELSQGMDGSWGYSKSPHYETHWRHRDRRATDPAVYVKAQNIELLARFPEDFAEHVAPEPWPFGEGKR